MGTLTGDLPSLSDHCPHKLPSSCRLTAHVPGLGLACCACQDRRPHSAYYSTYVDGVGLVNRGTRWQRYCFFCKEFWQNRLQAVDPPMDSSESRIPEIPDQTQFLEKWFDYHKGYRIIKEDDGGERRVEVKAEIPWKDVDPGTLPLKNDVERLATIRHAPVARVSDEPVESIESALDALLGEEDEETVPVTHGHLAQAVEPPRPLPPARRGPTDADRAAAEAANTRLAEADTLLADVEALHQRLTVELATAEAQLRERQNERRLALGEQRGAQQLLRVLEAQERATDRDAARFARVWGTRDEIRQQGVNYVSPLTDMFTRAYDRYRIAEEVRAEERASDEVTERQTRLISSLGPWYNGNGITDGDYAVDLEAPRDLPEEGPVQTLDDEEVNRPPPKTDEEMTVKLICKICLQQPADIAVMPCGHITMCTWCADVYMPVKDVDDTRLVKKTPCPLPYCKTVAKRRCRIYIS
jgi:hypothetical protein